VHIKLFPLSWGMRPEGRGSRGCSVRARGGAGRKTCAVLP